MDHPTNKTILSGIQPSGSIHLGNYLGALKQWVALQEDNTVYYCIVDLHALTVPYEPERLRERIEPWESIGLHADQVDPQDYLIDWRRGGRGLRYVHFYTNPELHNLAETAGFTVNGIFTSDGETESLGLYHIWEYSPP